MELGIENSIALYFFLTLPLLTFIIEHHVSYQELLD